MHNKFLTALLTAVLMIAASPVVFAQMTDEAIIDYVKTHSGSGEDEQTIAKALMSKGVSLEQIKALKARCDAEAAGEFKTADNLVTERDTTGTRKITDDLSQRPVALTQRTPASIFGHEIFNNETLTFEPNQNVATPENYKLGPGDQIVIDIWGVNEAHVTQSISPEGRIMISQIGPVYLSGLTIKEARSRIRKIFAQKYASEGDVIPDSKISVTLGNIRTIQVNILGEVGIPGTYRLSAFSSIFNALYIAGGVNDTGSMRKVKIVRSGEEVAEVDLYKLLFSGSLATDHRLEDGDVILVPVYANLVTIDGEVKRPMRYEMIDGETVADLIEYSGGYASRAFETELSIVRKVEKEYKLVTVTADKYADTPVFNGDVATVSAVADRFQNKVEVKGCVYRPGIYELGGEIATVRQLIGHASGVKPDAYMGRAMLVRENDDLSLETKSFNLAQLINGQCEDILLRKNDVLIVSSNESLRGDQYVTVIGHVTSPGNFVYASHTSIKDAIFQAGGFADGASTVKIDVSRRIDNPLSVTPSDNMAEVFTFSVENGVSYDGIENFFLKPYDVIAVRKSPEYKEQTFVNISGQVAFEGDYAITSNNERLSDIVRRAGGITEHAYLQGARLVRRMGEDEKNVRRATLSMIESGAVGKDSVDTSIGLLAATYSVGIQLDKALENPGSDYDLVIRKDDSIIIPEYMGTVKIQGTVMYPNTVVYAPGEGLHYYIDQAGGYAYRAKKGAVYVVYMNGNVRKIRKASDIKPGCEIIVPQKPEKKQMSTSEILSMGTAAASIATMAATIVNIFK